MDTDYYNQIKKFITHRLENRPWCSDIDCPFKWASTFLPMIKSCEQDEDYEGAKAIKDSIKEFLNRFLSKEEQITDKDTLKVPEYVKSDIKGIICFVDENGNSYSGPI